MTDQEAEILKKWRRNDPHSLVDFLSGLWFVPEKTIRIDETEDKYYLQLNTMSWKGNEDIIHALMDNVIFWHKHWRKTERGGHYTFEFEK